MQLELGELREFSSREMPWIIEPLLAALPGLREHYCSEDRPGGFVQRLAEGTYIPHIIEHAALELSVRAGIGVGFGRARQAGAPGMYNIIVEYKEEQAMRRLLETAVGLIEALVRREPFPLEEKINEAARIAEANDLGPSTRAILEAARRRKIPFRRLNNESLIQFGYGKFRRLVQAAMTDRTSAVAVDIASDKHLVKTMLAGAGLPVPAGAVAGTPEDALGIFKAMRPPAVVKPLNANQGKGVSLNCSTAGDILQAFHIARRFSSGVIVEEQFTGRDYRVLVIGGRVAAASERTPAHVVGNGASTVGELIEEENRSNALRGDGHSKPLTKIKVDDVVFACIRKKGLSLSSIPPRGETVYLRESVNLSTGGTAEDVTDRVHPDTARLCERAARTIGLEDICGVDIISEDISEPLRARGNGIIELNAAPGLRMHLFPGKGSRRDVGGAIMELLYPPGAPSRVPIISITGTNGKTTVARMVSHIIAETGAIAGMTSTDGIYIGQERVLEADATGPDSARAVLSDPSVEMAVLETARGGIIRRGLGYDWSDVGVITNIQEDHIGQDGIEGIRDLVFIKSLVAECVREGGTLVLNADDEHAAGLERAPHVSGSIRRQIVYFSMTEDNAVLGRNRRKAGTRNYFVKDGVIIEAYAGPEAPGGSESPVIRVSDIPAAMEGTCEFNVQNAMAALAACRALGIDLKSAARGLASFTSNTHNGGRVNLYRLRKGFLLLDYGHNPHALQAVSRMASLQGYRRITGIVGLPGDRADWLLAESVQSFDRLIIREDKDLRGRKPGETADLLYGAARAASTGAEISLVPDEAEALSKAVSEMQDGELIVLFYEKAGAALEAMLREHGAVPAAARGTPAALRPA
jgi:cyanophycin synthetase